MTTIREQALQAIERKLIAAFPDQDVARNRDVRGRLCDAGDVVLYDGEEANRETMLSPLAYVITWAGEIQILVQNSDRAVREQMIDDLLVVLGGVFPSSPPDNLGGLVMYVSLNSLNLHDEPVEGAADIKGASVDIEFEYETSSSVG